MPGPHDPPRGGERAVDRQAFYLLKKINQAVRQFAMIRPGDRIAVAVSGGKDSLSLLRLLQIRQVTAAEPYELAAVHVLADSSGILESHPPLMTWLAAAGVPYRVVEPELPAGESLPLNCQRCTWLRRKALFQAADDLRCNVVAFAHHADDAAQTTLLNLLYGGSARTLPPQADYFGGRFRLIRPLFYVPETDLARFARATGCPPPPPTCPRAGHTSRLRTRTMLEMLGRDYLTQVRTNLIQSGLRGLAD
jgi:tRNA 2-thiocytidine biosynthesis protein TtcA